MDRRAFLKIGASALVFGALPGCDSTKSKVRHSSYPIIVDSNRTIGHWARKAVFEKVAETIDTDVLIVGGGVAGLAAAASLKGRTGVLCELNEQLGGTSGAIEIEGTLYAQGAHYDNTYPHFFGDEVLSLLERLNVIRFNGLSNSWDFVDQQHLISTHQLEQCFHQGQYQKSVFPDSELKHNFIDLIRPYAEKMILPTRLMSNELAELDQLTFEAYLKKYLPVNDAFIQSVDYQMLDDYGGNSGQVSALAGIHYYRCRSYFEKPEPKTFSPAEGNYYFIDKLSKGLDNVELKCGQLVYGLEQSKSGWVVDVWNVKEQKRLSYRCNQVIYAGQKHLLKYIHSGAYNQFKDVEYAPWVVINVVLENIEIDAIWQNDYLSANTPFLGFVNSAAQSKKGPQVLTAYYCYPKVYHHLLVDIEQQPKRIVDETVELMGRYFNLDLSAYVKEVFVKVHGHAMPIPVPGYLSKKRVLNQDGLIFAGVDTGRLPLFLDALDSGIQAAKLS